MAKKQDEVKNRPLATEPQPEAPAPEPAEQPAPAAKEDEFLANAPHDLKNDGFFEDAPELKEEKPYVNIWATSLGLAGMLVGAVGIFIFHWLGFIGIALAGGALAAELIINKKEDKHDPQAFVYCISGFILGLIAAILLFA